jgi:hypothetical protein
MVSDLTTIRRNAAARIAARFFIESCTFMPRVGEPVICKAYLSQETELQPVAYDQVSDIDQLSVVYLKTEIADDIVEAGSYFTIEGTKYFVQSVAETDTEILGRVIVKV